MYTGRPEQGSFRTVPGKPLLQQRSSPNGTLRCQCWPDPADHSSRRGRRRKTRRQPVHSVWPLPKRVSVAGRIVRTSRGLAAAERHSDQETTTGPQEIGEACPRIQVSGLPSARSTSAIHRVIATDVFDYGYCKYKVEYSRPEGGCEHVPATPRIPGCGLAARSRPTRNGILRPSRACK